jgi:hypothetical protein
LSSKPHPKSTSAVIERFTIPTDSRHPVSNEAWNHVSVYIQEKSYFPSKNPLLRHMSAVLPSSRFVSKFALLKVNDITAINIWHFDITSYNFLSSM